MWWRWAPPQPWRAPRWSRRRSWPKRNPTRRSVAKKDVQVIAFQQTWNTIAKECTEHLWSRRRGLCGGLAAAGIHPRHPMVDELPAGELQARLQAGHGSRIHRTWFKQCSAAGVGIIADVVLNQTTGADVATGDQAGVAGSKYNGSTGELPGIRHQAVSGRHHRSRLPQLRPRTSPTTPISRKCRNAA